LSRPGQVRQGGQHVIVEVAGFGARIHGQCQHPQRFQRLGLAGSPAVLGLDHDAIDGTADDALPAAATLTGNLLAPATPNPTGWKITKLNPATGAFTGSFVLRDQLAPAPAKPVARTITFSGVLRQRPDLASPDDPLIGAGHFLVAPAGGAAVTEKTSGAILLLAP
jgi:hypothetical protein